MKRTTIVDVGRLAGVSMKTVSRVLNNAPYVTEEIRTRVKAAAAELNYHPNVMAQALVRRRSNLIGLIYEKPSPSYVVDLQMGVLDRLRGERYRLVVIPVESAEERANEIVGLVRSAALDGVVLAPPACDHPVILAQLAAAGIQVARIAPTHALDQGAVTLIDDGAAAQAVAAHLLELGHRDVAVILGDASHPSVAARLVGYRAAFAAVGATLSDRRIAQGAYSFESGYEAARQLLAGPTPPTAILAQNDDMAVGALMAARELGFDLPGDLSIAGFDGSDIARIAWPRITTVRQPVFDMAHSAADMLVRALEGDTGVTRTEHGHELLIRDSTAPPRPRRP